MELHGIPRNPIGSQCLLGARDEPRDHLAVRGNHLGTTYDHLGGHLGATWRCRETAYNPRK